MEEFDEKDFFDNTSLIPEDEAEELEKQHPGFLYGAISLLIIVGMLYVYGGVQQLLFFQPTSPDVGMTPKESVLNLETLELPVKVFALRGEVGGTERSGDNIAGLVSGASLVWDQADIRLNIVSVHDVYVDGDIVGEFLGNTWHLVREIDSYDDSVLNIFLVNKMRGLNGIAFPGMRIAAVADITAGYDFRTLAHEVGHVLGLGHVEGSMLRLMHQGSTGDRLTSEEILKSREVVKEIIEGYQNEKQ